MSYDKSAPNFINAYTINSSGGIQSWGSAGIPEMDPFFDAEALNKQLINSKLENLKKMKEFEGMMEKVKESFETIKPKKK